MVYQVTIHKNCSRCPPPEPMYGWASFQKYRGSCKWSNRHTIRVGKVSIFNLCWTH